MLVHVGLLLVQNGGHYLSLDLRAMTKMSLWFFVPCWGHVGPMLSLCWAKNGAQMHTPLLSLVGAMLGLHWVYVGTYLWDG